MVQTPLWKQEFEICKHVPPRWWCFPNDSSSSVVTVTLASSLQTFIFTCFLSACRRTLRSTFAFKFAQMAWGVVLNQKKDITATKLQILFANLVDLKARMSEISWASYRHSATPAMFETSLARLWLNLLRHPSCFMTDFWFVQTLL